MTTKKRVLVKMISLHQRIKRRNVVYRKTNKHVQEVIQLTQTRLILNIHLYTMEYIKNSLLIILLLFHCASTFYYNKGSVYHNQSSFSRTLFTESV